MRRTRYTLTCLSVLGALALFVPAPTLASGPGSSAGDQQYVDPLAGSSTTTSTPAPTATAPATQSAPPPAQSSSTLSSSSPTATAAASSSSSSSNAPSGQSSSATLPYTGLNAWLGAAVGVGLLGAGVVLRRAGRST